VTVIVALRLVVLLERMAPFGVLSTRATCGMLLVLGLVVMAR
jgi:hypothetical protein